MSRIGSEAIGICVGAAGVRYSRMRRSGEKLALLDHGEVALPVGAVHAGLVNDPVAVTSAIRRAMEQTSYRNGRPPRRTVIAAPPPAVVVRMLKLPPMPEHEIKQAARWEASQFWPFPIEELCYDVHLVSSGEKGGQCEVLFFGARASALESLLSAVDAAGVEAAAVEPSSVAIARCLAAFGVVMQGSTAVVNIERDYGETLVVRDGQLRMARGLPLVQADGCDALIREIQRSIEYFRVQHGWSKVDRILLTGDAPELGKLAERLGGATDVAVERLRAVDPGKLDLTGGGTGSGEPDPVSIGLALREVSEW